MTVSPKKDQNTSGKVRRDINFGQKNEVKSLSSARVPEEVQYPLTPAKALKLFMQYLTDYEKGEILDYKQIYFLGLNAKKIKGSPLH